MITLCLVLLLIGVFCLIAEMFIPGFGVSGLTGLALMIAAAVLAVMFVPYGWFFVSAEAVLLALIVYFMFRFIKKKQLQGKLILTETLNDDIPQIVDLSAFVGREGVTKTPLKPFGEADFNGVGMEVNADNAYVEKNTRVKVTEVRQNTLIVAALN